MNSALLLRSSGLVAVTVALFVGCGGRIEADYLSDGGAELQDGNCGNGRIDKGEECDGTHLGGATCSSATMNSRSTGQLTCKQCKLVTTACSGTGQGGATGTGGRSSTGGAFGTGGGFGTGGRFGTGGGVGTGGRVGGTGGTSGTATPCTSSSDCRGREVCCGTLANNQYTFSCSTTCARTDVTAECHTSADCGRNEVCCATTNQTGTTYTSIACAATCNANGERPLCAMNSDCPNGTTCRASRVLPSDFSMCR